jgi:putative protease
LRTQSSFNLEELVEGVRFVHNRGKRIYLPLNLFTHNKDIETCRALLRPSAKLNQMA